MAYQKVTENKFKAIKILLNSGATYAEISESFGVSDYVTRFVKTSETFEEYKHKMYINSSGYRKKVAAEQKKKEAEEKAAAEKAEQEGKKAYSEPEVQVVEHRQSVQIQATHFMMEELREMKELLKGISNKLAYIVEELTGEVKHD